MIRKNSFQRRDFIKKSAAGALGQGLSIKGLSSLKVSDSGARRGIIRLDTSHSTAFTRALNDPAAKPEFSGFRITAAYPKGSNDIKSSADRIPSYTEEMKSFGVEIVELIEELLGKVNCVLLETNDGRLHPEQAIPVMRAGKRMFIDKPVTASLADAVAIYKATEHFRVQVFSSSSLRHTPGIKEISEGSKGKVLDADTCSPATSEATHPDLFWYVVHGVESLFTLMGKGCSKVIRAYTENFNMVEGTWIDDRIGSFRGIRKGRSDYGGTVSGEKGISVLGKYSGYDPLLLKILEFFKTVIPPVEQSETLEIFTFMTAADESRKRSGVPVETAPVLARAGKIAERTLSKYF